MLASRARFLALYVACSLPLAQSLHLALLPHTPPLAAAFVPPPPPKKHMLVPRPAARPDERIATRRTSAHMSLRGGFSAAGLLASIVAAAESMPALVLLGFTIGLEVLATTFMKLAATRSSSLWFVGIYLCYGLCFSIFPLALRRLPLSLAYATWSGVGTAASVVIGAMAFGEKITLAKLGYMALIVAGVVGLNF